MAEKTVRRKKKKDELDEGKPTDEETAVAKYLRFNLATKSCNFMGNKVEYFTGSKAVDFLLDSKWASDSKNTPAIFTHRESVVKFLDILLQKGFFMRALKVAVKKKEKEGKEGEGKKKSKKSEKSEKEKDPAQEGEKKEKKEKKEKEKEKSKSDDSGDKKQKEGKRKIKLEGTNEQIFLDGNDAYVWIFDPIKPLHYVYGLGLVIGAIAVCLFPLWPPWMRVGTYYLSVGGACLVGSIVVLAIVRTIIYGIIWGVTLGKISWWLFPNLLADVGILESFQPIYSIEYSSQEGKGGGDGKEEKENEANQDSEDNENDKDETQTDNVENLGESEGNSKTKEQISEDGPSEDKPESIQTESGPDEGEEEQQDEESNANEEENISETSEKSESSSSQGTKDFEMVQREDVIADVDTQA